MKSGYPQKNLEFQENIGPVVPGPTPGDLRRIDRTSPGEQGYQLSCLHPHGYGRYVDLFYACMNEDFGACIYRGTCCNDIVYK